MRPGDMVVTTRGCTPWNSARELWVAVDRSRLGVFVRENAMIQEALFDGVVLQFPAGILEVVR